MQKLLQKAARPLEFLLGLVFLAGALAKMTNINLFAVQIAAYGVITDKTWLPAAALTTLAMETILGCFLLLGLPRKKTILSALLALLAVFTALILYGWFFHNLQDCGCFGKLEIGPKSSIAKNLLFALMALAAWRGFSVGERPPAAPRRTLLKLGLSCAIAALMLATATQNKSREDLVNSENTGPFARFVFDLPEGHFDLGHGEYLVALFSMGCDHCLAEAPKLNDLAELPGLPTVVALCFEESPGDMEEFRALVNPTYPMYSLGNQIRIFFSLIGKEPPRFTLIRDGFPIASWDDQAPAYEDILQAREINTPQGS